MDDLGQADCDTYCLSKLYMLRESLIEAWDSNPYLEATSSDSAKKLISVIENALTQTGLGYSMNNPLPTKRALRRYIRLVVPSCCMSKVSRGIKWPNGQYCALMPVW